MFLIKSRDSIRISKSKVVSYLKSNGFKRLKTGLYENLETGEHCKITNSAKLDHKLLTFIKSAR